MYYLAPYDLLMWPKGPNEKSQKYKLYLPLDFRFHPLFDTCPPTEITKVPQTPHSPFSGEIWTIYFSAFNLLYDLVHSILNESQLFFSSLFKLYSNLYHWFLGCTFSFSLLIDLHSIHHRRSQMLHIYAMLMGCTCVLGFPSVTMMIIS